VLTRMPGVVNQRGGLWKTTLGRPQAHALVPRGTEVCSVDAGPPATAPDGAASAADGTPSSVSVVYPRTAGTKGHREVLPSDPMAGDLLADCPAAVDSPVPYRESIQLKIDKNNA
jgi:chromosome partitioning protein